MTRARICPVPDCTKAVPAGNKQGWCEDHSHDWAMAAEIPVEHRRAAGALRRMAAVVTEDTFVVVRDVYCSYCRLTFLQAMGSRQPCSPYGLHLRGGPNGRRKRNGDGGDDDCEAEPQRRDLGIRSAVQSSA